MSKILAERQSTIREHNLIELSRRIALRWFSRKGLDSLTVECSASDVQSLAWEMLCQRPHLRDKTIAYWACRKIQTRIASLRDSGETANGDEPAYEQGVTATELNDWLRTRPEQQQRVAEMLVSGMSVQEVADAIGVSHQRVSQIRVDLANAWNAA
jgi:hypothetical protein